MPSPWFLFILIATWMVYGCLRVIGKEYASAVAWHDLRVQVQKLRLDQQRRLDRADGTEPSLRRIVRGNTDDLPSLVEAVDPTKKAVEVLEAVEVGEAIAA